MAYFVWTPRLSNPARCVSTKAVGPDALLEKVSLLANAVLHLLPRWLRDPWDESGQTARPAGLTWLPAPADAQRMSPLQPCSAFRTTANTHRDRVLSQDAWLCGVAITLRGRYKAHAMRAWRMDHVASKSFDFDDESAGMSIGLLHRNEGPFAYIQRVIVGVCGSGNRYA